MHRFVRRSAFLISSIIFLLGILAGCGNASSNSSQSDKNGSSKIKIVAAEDFYGEVAKAVGGDHVTVTSIINKPSMDPHNFEPTPDIAKNVHLARVVVYNGIGYDGWMNDLVSSGNSDKTLIRVAEDVMNKKDGDDEHVWYNPETMPKLANAIADRLAKIDPDHAHDFHQNAKDYQESIKPVSDLVEKLSQKSDNQNVDVSEPVFDYMIEALGYKTKNNHFKQAVEEGTDPSPRDIQEMQRDIESKRIVFFVSNIQEMSPTVEKMVNLAEKKDVPVVKITETLPEGKNYKTWMLDALNQVEKAQK
ncbi:metal ABC transporter substrate-binding protein [Sporolactobacillus sp. THM7-7]|nr:metal ABC transporter substrate-binding protein [Sporolactobacillus sp. THM7-7]